MASKRFAAGALRQLVAERNARLIVLQLSEETAARELVHLDADKALRALKAHGFRLGFVGSLPTSDGVGSSKMLELFDSVGRVTIDEVLARQSIIVAEDGLEPNGVSGVASLTVPKDLSNEPTLLSRIAQEAVGSEDCLDTSRRMFGPHRVASTQIFFESALSFGLVNLKPIVPGHVLIVPKRSVARFELLGGDEVSDLWCTAQLVGRKLEKHYKASSLTFAVQDGPAAGQTVPHVHIHVIPRVANDFEQNDDIYTEIEHHERALHVDSDSRSARSESAMALEASALRQLFQ